MKIVARKVVTFYTRKGITIVLGGYLMIPWHSEIKERLGKVCELCHGISCWESCFKNSV